jgi:hypothetical protein
VPTSKLSQARQTPAQEAATDDLFLSCNTEDSIQGIAHAESDFAQQVGVTPSIPPAQLPASGQGQNDQELNASNADDSLNAIAASISERTPIIASSPVNSVTRKRALDSEALAARADKRQKRAHTLPQDLAAVALAYPPLEEESDAGYARRLFELGSRGVATACVGGEILNLEQLHLLSGVRMWDLQRDSILQTLPEELVPVTRAFPRLPEEASNNRRYARRLYNESLANAPMSRIGGELLRRDQLALLSGATERSLQADRTLQALPDELTPIAHAYPRQPDEIKSNIKYALRLNFLSQQGIQTARVAGQALTIPQLCLLSGVKESKLSNGLLGTSADTSGRANRKTQSRMASAQQAASGALFVSWNSKDPIQGIAHAESDFAQQLSVTPSVLPPAQSPAPSHGQDDRGPDVSNADEEPVALPPELVTVANHHPRQANEIGSNLAYALRLLYLSHQEIHTARVAGQALTIPQLCLLTGVRESTLKKRLLGK